MGRVTKIALLVTIFGTIFTMSPGCGAISSFDSQVNTIAGPFGFSMARWEFGALTASLKQTIAGGNLRKDADGEVRHVKEYFSLVERIRGLTSNIEITRTGGWQDAVSNQGELDRLEKQKAGLQDDVQRILARQIREVLSEQGIFNPADRFLGLSVAFPPINFNLEKPPYLLVISARDRIETIKEVTLEQDLSLEKKEQIEARVEKLGVSALVVKLGGFGGTYPTFVTDDTDIRFTLDTAIEEWLHQYLSFTPLGFRYILHLTGIARDKEIVTMNETVAGMVSREIGALVYGKYYGKVDAAPAPAKADGTFSREMRQIRQTVDSYLAAGKIEEAERFMEQKRQELAGKGYHIRKLNQAYFAFHGVYGDGPSSVSPIGPEMRELRQKSATLKDFLNRVASMTGRQSLASALQSD